MSSAGTKPLSELALKVLALIGEHGPCSYKELDPRKELDLIEAGYALADLRAAGMIRWGGQPYSIYELTDEGEGLLEGLAEGAMNEH